MEAAQREISDRFGLERWTIYPHAETCYGCLYLDGRVFFAFEGPQPRLHPNCHCERLPVPTAGLSGVALIRLVLEARANGGQARLLEEEAGRRAREDREEQAARGRRFR